MQVSVELPWPPSVNRYWRRNGNRYFICVDGVKFRNDVSMLCHKYLHMFDGQVRLSLSIAAYPPDKRRRDLDNVLKAIGDSLEHAQVFKDDNQIDRLVVSRMPELLSKVVVTINKL